MSTNLFWSTYLFFKVEFAIAKAFILCFIKGDSMNTPKKVCSSHIPNTNTTQKIAAPWYINILPPSLLALLTTLFYLPSLHYPFQFDDIANISKKFYIRFDNPLERWWRGPRWLGDLINRINYIMGQFDPFVYRITNLAIHITAGLLVHFLIKKLCSLTKPTTFMHNNANIIGFVTAALFLLHPVQTQTVSYVIQARVEGLGSLMVIALAYLFTLAATHHNQWLKTLYTILLFAVGLLAWGSKELIIVTPFLLALITWFFIADTTWEKCKKQLLLLGSFSIYFFGLALHYLTTKFTIDTIALKQVAGNNSGNILTSHAYDVITPFQFLISQFKVVLHYIWMFFWPVGTSVEYDWRLAKSFFSLDSFVPFLLLATLYTFIIFACIKKRNTLLSFGFLWFLICVAPRSSIIPSPELVCDYKTYLASLGIFFIIAYGITHLLSTLTTLIRLATPKLEAYAQYADLRIATALLLFIPLGFSAMLHNKIWESGEAFWKYNSEKAPLKARVHNNYGVALNEAGKIDESIKAYQRAINLDKHYSDPLSNIAVAYCLKDDLDKAIDSLKMALNITPNYPEAYNNLGSLYVKKKDYESAERMLNTAISLRPYYGKAYYNMGRMYLEREQQEKAWNYFKKAIENDLDTPDGYFTFAQVSVRLKKYPEAARAYELIVERGAANEQVWFGLANVSFLLGHYEKAENIYAKLIRDNPQDMRYMYNLAETLFTKKEYAKAHDIFQKITTMPQPAPQAFFRVANCLEKLNRLDLAQNYLTALTKVNAPEDFKQKVQGEITRLALQEHMNQNGGTKIGLNKMKEILALQKEHPATDVKS